MPGWGTNWADRGSHGGSAHLTHLLVPITIYILSSIVHYVKSCFNLLQYGNLLCIIIDIAM